MNKNKNKIILENIGTDVYTLMARGHHDLDEFIKEIIQEYPSWYRTLGKPEHIYFKRVFNRFVECPKETRGCFPATYISEGEK